VNGTKMEHLVQESVKSEMEVTSRSNPKWKQPIGQIKNGSNQSVKSGMEVTSRSNPLIGNKPSQKNMKKIREFN